MIDFIKRWLDNRKEQKRILNESCDQFVSKIESLCAENSMLFQPLTEFVEPNKGVAWEKRGASLISEVSATQRQQ